MTWTTVASESNSMMLQGGMRRLNLILLRVGTNTRDWAEPTFSNDDTTSRGGNTCVKTNYVTNNNGFTNKDIRKAIIVLEPPWWWEGSSLKLSPIRWTSGKSILPLPDIMKKRSGSKKVPRQKRRMIREKWLKKRKKNKVFYGGRKLGRKN